MEQQELELEAARREFQLLMARLFVDAYPESVRAQDKEGNVPLHGAVVIRHSVAVARILVETWPDACLMANKDGMLPIHVAVRAVARAARTHRAGGH